MRHNDILGLLQNLTKAKVTQQKIADILGCNIGAISARATRNSSYSIEEVKTISDYFNVNLLSDNMSENNYNCNTTSGTVHCCHVECSEIVYWEELPEELKLSYITSLHTDRELIENDWKRKPKDLRIIPMLGNKMNTYEPAFRDRDVLIIDLSQTDINKEGVYFFTSKNNIYLFINRLELKLDGSIYASWNENGVQDGRLISTEEQKEVDFRVIGRVIKNMSNTLL